MFISIPCSFFLIQKNTINILCFYLQYLLGSYYRNVLLNNYYLTGYSFPAGGEVICTVPLLLAPKATCK